MKHAIPQILLDPVNLKTKFIILPGVDDTEEVLKEVGDFLTRKGMEVKPGRGVTATARMGEVEYVVCFAYERSPRSISTETSVRKVSTVSETKFRREVRVEEIDIRELPDFA